MALEYVPVLLLAIVDSINPSALLVTIHLLLTTSSYVSRVLGYVAGIFLSYFSLGILLMLGLDTVWVWIKGPVVYAVEGVAGALMLLYSSIAPGGGGRSERWRERVPRSRHLGALFTMGILVTILEFPTALPYFGAIVILTNANLAAAQWLPLLAVYNAGGGPIPRWDADDPDLFVERISYSETRTYVRQVWLYDAIYRELARAED